MMNTSVYGNEFSQNDMENIKTQNRIILRTFIKKLISNNKEDNTFREFIETYFPVSKIDTLTDREIQNKLLRLSNISNILNTNDFNTAEMLCEIVKGFSESIVPRIISKYPKYQFISPIINKNMTNILNKIRNERGNLLEKLQHLSNSITNGEIEFKSTWVSALEGMGVLGVAAIGFMLLERYIMMEEANDSNKHKLDENDIEIIPTKIAKKSEEFCNNMESFRQKLHDAQTKNNIAAEKEYEESTIAIAEEEEDRTIALEIIAKDVGNSITAEDNRNITALETTTLAEDNSITALEIIAKDVEVTAEDNSITALQTTIAEITAEDNSTTALETTIAAEDNSNTALETTIAETTAKDNSITALETTIAEDVDITAEDNSITDVETTTEKKETETEDNSITALETTIAEITAKDNSTTALDTTIADTTEEEEEEEEKKETEDNSITALEMESITAEDEEEKKSITVETKIDESSMVNNERDLDQEMEYDSNYVDYFNF